MKLSILMTAMKNRPWHIQHNSIIGQIEELGDVGVEFDMDLDSGERTSGHKRNRLIGRTSGDYIAFVDDDDIVADDYVASLLKGVESGADVITFNLQFTRQDFKDEHPGKHEFWTFGLHQQNRKIGLMSANHLCAWKRSLATKVAWPAELGFYDDHCWFEPLLHSGYVKTEHHVPKVLYHYLYDPKVTENQKGDRKHYTSKYIGKGLRCFHDRKNPGEILIEVSPVIDQRVVKPEGMIPVRDKNNVLHIRDVVTLDHYHTIRWLQ